MKFKKIPRRCPRPITPRRLKASQRALQKERDKFPLLSDWVAEQQPTPEQRLVKFQGWELEAEKKSRKYAALVWCRSIKILYSLPFEVRQELLKEWNESHLPKTHEYFAEFLTTCIPSAKEAALKRLEESIINRRQSILKNKL